MWACNTALWLKHIESQTDFDSLGMEKSGKCPYLLWKLRNCSCVICMSQFLYILVCFHACVFFNVFFCYSMYVSLSKVGWVAQWGMYVYVRIGMCMRVRERQRRMAVRRQVGGHQIIFCSITCAQSRTTAVTHTSSTYCMSVQNVGHFDDRCVSGQLDKLFPLAFSLYSNQIWTQLGLPVNENPTIVIETDKK